jgi:hypothetical protein
MSRVAAMAVFEAATGRTTLNGTMNHRLSMILLLVLVVGGGLAIGYMTAPGEWYAQLAKPGFTPRGGHSGRSGRHSMSSLRLPGGGSGAAIAAVGR